MTEHRHPINQLEKHVKKQGIKGLLPQSLPDRLLKRMLEEAEAIENDTTEETPSSLLLMSVLQLHIRKKLTGNIELLIEPEKLMEYFDLYIAQLRFEDMRRQNKIEISDKSLPTIKNIFDKNRDID